MRRETLVIATVTDAEPSRKYGETQCVAAINIHTKEMRRIYPITPSEVKRLKIKRGALLSVAIRDGENKDKRIESVKVDTSQSKNLGTRYDAFVERYAEEHIVGCSFIKQCRPFKQPDPSFYWAKVHDVRQRTKHGEQYWAFKCEDPDCKGHMMKIKDSQYKRLHDGDKILLGRHSQERMIHPFLVGVVG